MSEKLQADNLGEITLTTWYSPELEATVTVNWFVEDEGLAARSTSTETNNDSNSSRMNRRAAGQFDDRGQLQKDVMQQVRAALTQFIFLEPADAAATGAEAGGVDRTQLQRAVAHANQTCSAAGIKVASIDLLMEQPHAINGKSGPRCRVTSSPPATLILHWLSGKEACRLEAESWQTIGEVKELAISTTGKSVKAYSCKLLCAGHGFLQDSTSISSLGFAGQTVTLQIIVRVLGWNLELKGANTEIYEEGLKARRVSDFGQAIAFCTYPARECRVRILEMNQRWQGSLEVGFALRDPEELKFKQATVHACNIEDSVCCSSSEDWHAELAVGAIVGWELSEGGDILVRIGERRWKLPGGSDDIQGTVYPMVGIYGSTEAIELMH